MSGRRAGLLGCLLVAVLPGAARAAAAAAAIAPRPPVARLLLDGAYPLEVAHPFPAALLHWLDSLTALGPPAGTAGKTVPAHRRTYRRTFGSPAAEQLAAMREFRDARLAGARREDPRELTLAFLGAASLDDALERAGALLDPPRAEALARALRHLAPLYEDVWQSGATPRAFLERSTSASSRRELSRFLAGVARFYGVDPQAGPPPQVVLVPVASGFGTHAQAIGRFLLVEIRDGERLEDEVAPIVHENAHFLFQRIDDARMRELAAAALEAGGSGHAAWQYLKEALPTALAQGVAQRRFRPGRWSRDDPWYHVRGIDDYAKRIFPLVERALRRGRTLDEALVRELVALTPR